MGARGEIAPVYRESLPVLVVSLAGGVFAGVVLGTEGMRAGFRAYPGLLLALPAFLATRGNVWGALGAKIASGLHQGLLEPSFSRDPRLVHAVAAAVTNGIGLSVFVGVLSWGPPSAFHDGYGPVASVDSSIAGWRSWRARGLSRPSAPLRSGVCPYPSNDTQLCREFPDVVGR